MIPAQLHAEDENGIIRRTLEDKAFDESASTYIHDPKHHNETWSRIPLDARIIGICETFESGMIDSRGGVPSTLTFGDRTGYKMKAMFPNHISETTDIHYLPFSQYENQVGTANNSPYYQDYPSWRLATGDVVRFAGMDQSSTENKAFNRGAPTTVNIVDDGRAMIIEAEAGRVPAFNNDYEQTPWSADATTNGREDTLWWNSKVWILYGKQSDSDSSFKDWDLFLYCVNTVDIHGDKNLLLADRTVPYSQARYYLNNYQKIIQPWKVIANDNTSSIYGSHNSQADKVYYPGDSAFVLRNNAGEDSGEDVGILLEMWSDGPDGDNKALADDQFARSGQSIDDTDPFRMSLGFGDFDNTDFSDLADDNHMPVGYKCEWSVWGIYDKAGRWSKNGKAVRSTHGFKPDENVNNGNFWASGYVTSGEFNEDFNPFHDFNDITPMTWGENIGWEVNDEGVSGRAIETIAGSLHPKNPYSQLYCANRMYHNRQWGGTDTEYTGAGVNSNGAEHAVTFLGNTTGKFILRTNPMARSMHGDDNDADIEDGDMTSFYGCLTFNIGNYDQSVTKNYSNTLTLYTIDDFSGHRGAVTYDTTGSVDPTSMESSDTNLNTYVSGVKMGRPNVGGPEIENPYYYREQMTVGSETRWPFTSKNGGYAGENDEFDIGWDGYKPPYLFSPGSGYYVYINRRWKNQSPRINAMDYLGEVGNFVAPDGNVINFFDIWNRQGSWDYQHDYDENDPFTYSNRRHNFSTTCIGDVVQTHSQSTLKWNAPLSTWEPLYVTDTSTDDSVLASTKEDLGVWIPVEDFILGINIRDLMFGIRMNPILILTE